MSWGEYWYVEWPPCICCFEDRSQCADLGQIFPLEASIDLVEDDTGPWHALRSGRDCPFHRHRSASIQTCPEEECSWWALHATLTWWWPLMGPKHMHRTQGNCILFAGISLESQCLALLFLFVRLICRWWSSFIMNESVLVAVVSWISSLLCLLAMLCWAYSFLMEYDVHTFLDALALIATVSVILCMTVHRQIKVTYQKAQDKVKFYYVVSRHQQLEDYAPSRRHQVITFPPSPSWWVYASKREFVFWIASHSEHVSSSVSRGLWQHMHRQHRTHTSV